jgi:hypothetical protein
MAQKVLVPIIRPTKASRAIAGKVVKRIKAGENTTQIGKDLAREIQETPPKAK